MALLSKSNENILLGIAAVVVGYIGYKTYRAAQKVKDVASDIIDRGVDFVAEDINPTSEYNVVNQTIGEPVNNAVESVTGHGLGGTIFCLFNSDSPVCNEKLFDFAMAQNLPYYASDGKTINPDTLARFNAWEDMVL